MPKKVPQTREELQDQLAEQIGLLESLGDQYDDGNTSMAKPLAVTLRTLLHDTETSYSLLGQLGLKKGTLFWSTAQRYYPTNAMPYCALVSICVLENDVSCVPLLDGVPEGSVRQDDFWSWWSEVIFIDIHGTRFNRQDIVLYIANQDGGGHVDPKLDEEYARLSRHGSMGLTVNVNGKEVPIMKPERPAVRQIAHEVLKTLKPGYEKVLTLKEGAALLSFPRGFPGGLPLPPPGSIPLRFIPVKPASQHVRRNEPCPCGSGKKFAECCGKRK